MVQSTRARDETASEDTNASGHAMRRRFDRPASASDWLFLFLSCVVGLGLVLSFVADVYVAPLGFDEAYVLQAPVNLITGHGYASTDWAGGGAVVLFDPLLSTGPAVLLPTAATMAVFGVTIEAARWATLPFAVLLVVSAALLGRRIAGRWGALAALVGLLAINPATDYPATVVFGFADAIGEFPAAALILAAILLLPRSRLLSGVALGLAITTKLLGLLALPAIGLGALLIVPFAWRRAWWLGALKRAFALVAGIAIPILTWEAVKLVTLGLDGYRQLTASYFDVVLSNGSGADGGGGHVRERAEVFLHGFFGTPVLSAIVGFAVVACIVVWVIGSRRTTGSFEFLVVDRGRFLAMLGGVGTLAVFLAWWMLVSDRVWFRHVLPGVVVGVPILAAMAVLGVRFLLDRPSGSRRWRPLACSVATVAVLAVTLLHAASAFAAPYGWSRAEQLEDAQALRDLEVVQVQHFLGWQNPELLFLDRGIRTAPYKEGRGPILLSAMMKNDAYGYEVFQGQCVDVLYHREDTLLCVPVINP
ncbi:hypothetical protein ACGGZK_16655 [Agromyces sp. MMS24-K17]|uniref:hypothetical protein n=1 Tax=Agromyces sp. MMS24-K17 TaxID=3372850 RepID=UPI00375422FB